MFFKKSSEIENVLIISLDCVRPEALGCYPQRYPFRVRFPRGAKTPNIDRLCAGGHRFDQAFTHVPLTPCAHASLLTGLIPPKHGIRTLLGSKLNKDVTTLAEILSAKGWQCGAVVGAHALSSQFELARGFHYYDDDIQTGIKNWKLGERREAVDVTDRAVAWLTSLANNQPFFLFAHYFDAHTISLQSHNLSSHLDESRSSVGFRELLPEPLKAAIHPAVRKVRSGVNYVTHQARSEWKSRLAYFEMGGKYERHGRRYQLNQLAKIDREIGRLVKTVADQNKLDRTLIVILADHGEDFMEHGEANHGHFLYDTTLHVPLIIFPHLGTRPVVKEQVRIVDIFPTVLSVLGMEREQEIDGASLIDLLSAQPRTGVDMQHRKAYSETAWELIEESNPSHIEFMTCYAALRNPPWKLIWNRLENTYSLYRVDVAPYERYDQASNNLKVLTAMSRELRELAQAMPGGAGSPEDAIVERLKSLGYL